MLQLFKKKKSYVKNMTKTFFTNNCKYSIYIFLNILINFILIQLCILYMNTIELFFIFAY